MPALLSQRGHSNWLQLKLADKLVALRGIILMTTSCVQLRSQRNGRNPDVHVVTWRDFHHFSIRRLENNFWVKVNVPMFLTKYMAAHSAEGVFIERKRRPYPFIQVGTISSFILSRNPYANADLAMILGIWHFACKSHVDVKRVYCRFGNIVSDTTARAALISMSATSMEKMRTDTR
ncbi:hypothetical protein FB451DRAFT_1418235 [Mycena latifolia]|nr:hypothetical protein FB451DRAFT_1418235 [Mycena latifolia]